MERKGGLVGRRIARAAQGRLRVRLASLLPRGRRGGSSSLCPGGWGERRGGCPPRCPSSFPGSPVRPFFPYGGHQLKPGQSPAFPSAPALTTSDVSQMKTGCGPPSPLSLPARHALFSSLDGGETVGISSRCRSPGPRYVRNRRRRRPRWMPTESPSGSVVWSLRRRHRSRALRMRWGLPRAGALKTAKRSSVFFFVLFFTWGYPIS